MAPFVAAHFGFEIAIELPGTVNFGAVFPKANSEACKISCAQRGGFKHSWTNNGHAEHVGLELHQEVVGGGAAVDAQFIKNNIRIGLHHVENIGDLESNAFERSAREVAGGRPASESRDGAASILIPVRRTKASKSWDEIDAATISNRRSEQFNICG